MSEKKEPKELDVTQLVQDIYCSETLYNIKNVRDKVSEWLKNKNESKNNLAHEIYDLVLMLTEYKFDFNLVEKIVHESKELFIGQASKNSSQQEYPKTDFSLMLKNNLYWHIEVVEAHPMIQQDYEEFNAEILKIFKDNIFKDNIIISNNHNSYHNKQKDQVLCDKTYNYNIMRLNFWYNYFNHVLMHNLNRRSELIKLCAKDVAKVRDYVAESPNEITKQLDQIISYSNTEDILGIQEKLRKFLKEVEHEIISQDSYNLEDYFKYIDEQIKSKFDKKYQLKNETAATRKTLLVSVQISPHAENSEIIASVAKYLLEKMNSGVVRLAKDIFFQEIYILSTSLIKLERDGDSGVWSLSEN